MKKFLLKSVIFIFPIVLLAFILQPFVDKGLANSNTMSNYKEWNDIFQSKINSDLIIQGNSRARIHISPEHLDTVFKINSYNLGMDAYPFHMQYYRFLIYLKHNKKPKYIIQATDFTTLTKRTELFDYDQFIPYLNHQLIREAVVEYEGLDYRDFYIPFYKYLGDSDKLVSAFKALKGDSVSTNRNFKGFLSLDLKWNNSFSDFKKAHPKGYLHVIDTTALRLFDSFVSYCAKERIQLIFINTPIYYEANKLFLNQKSVDSVFLSYSDKYAIPYLDYSTDSICFDTLNFRSATHLNRRGVDKFNHKLSIDLKGILH